MSKPGILIIGRTPPPIGGVTIHIERLLYNLRRDNVPFEAMGLNSSTLKKLIPKYMSARVVHLNISSVYLRTILTLLSFIAGKKHINTYHGSLGNKSRIKNIFDKVSVRFCTYPLVLNEEAYRFASRYNRKAKEISAFIPPPFKEALPEEISRKIKAIRAGYKTVFCTNAFGVMYDDRGQEIYGISELVKVFREVCDKALIISDPSASYRNYFSENKIEISENVLMITVPHSFFEVLKLSDCYIRNTSTDGDSLSVKEALYLNKSVMATNCVKRPEGVLLYGLNNRSELTGKIKEGGDMGGPENQHPSNSYPQISGYPELKKIYEELAGS